MFRGGSILRLIDVCFNILIGFISITTIDVQTRLTLPDSVAAEVPVQIIESLDVRVAVDPLHFVDEVRSAADDPDRKEHHTVPSWDYQVRWESGGVRYDSMFHSGGDLLRMFKRLRDSGTRIGQVVVASDDDAPVDGTVIVYDVCKQIGFETPSIDLTIAEDTL